MNGTEAEGGGLERDERLAQMEMLTLGVMFVATVVGNGAVLGALSANRPPPNRPNLPRIHYFMLHLSIADMVTAWLNILPQLAWEVTYRFRGGGVLCKLVKFGQTLGPYLSSYVLMATALDRYQAICHPLTYCSWSGTRANTMVYTAWGFALAFSLPQVTIFSFREIAPEVYDCWAIFPQPYGEKFYVTWYTVSVFIVPLVALIYTYSCICRCIWRSAGYPISVASPHQLVSRAKINTVKQTIAVIVVYVACSSPFICAQLWASWDPDAYSSPFLEGATFTILTLLSSLNSCVNPWIYLVSNRELVVALWRWRWCGGGEEEDVERVGGSGGSGSSSGHKRAPQLFTESTILHEPSHTHTHLARWVITIPPNTTDVERNTLRLFSGGLHSRENIHPSSFDHPCRAARLKPDT